MKPLGYPLLADENIHPDVVAGLRTTGLDIRTVEDVGLAGQSDLEVLRHAHTAGRVVLTHDSDFGALAVLEAEPFTGIIFLRPGHINPAFVRGIIDAVRDTEMDVTPPFLIVAERRGDGVRIRLRQM